MTRFAQRLVGHDAAEDVVQDALAAAWRSRATFDHERRSARSWLLTIVANQASNHRRQHSDVPAQEVDPTASGSNATSAVEAVDLSRALQRLPERQRVVVALFYYCGLTTSECSDVMGCGAGTVKSTLSDARAARRLALGEDYE